MDTIGSLVAIVIGYIPRYFIFKKMGREGWEGIIPVYHNYVMFEELYGNGWKFLLLLIPLFNIYVLFKMYIDLAHKFKQSTGFGWGLILLTIVFEYLLAFNNEIQCDGTTYTVNFDETIGSSKTKAAADEAAALEKFKELLDSGAITQEEYDAKKKEILGQ